MKAIFEGPANLFRGPEGVGGQLTLSTKGLAFEPHALNLQRQAQVIQLGDIEQVEQVNTLGFIPNGLKVITPGAEYRFVVRKRRQWVEKINSAIAANAPISQQDS